MTYTLEAFAEGTLSAELAAGASSGTLNSGHTFQDATKIMLAIQPDVSANREIVEATISGDSITSITRAKDGTSDVTHPADSKVWGIFAPSNYTDLGKIAGGAAWTDWTPTLTNLSGGTLNYAKYIKIGKIVHFRFKYTLAGAGVAEGVSVSLPVEPAVTVGGYIGICEMFNYDGYRYIGRAFQNDTVSSVNIHAFRSDATYLSAVDLSSTIPFTWAADDYIEIRGTYEAA